MAVFLWHRLRDAGRADCQRLTVDEICSSIGADSLGYITLEDLVEATEVAEDKLCRACFDGIYPVPLPDPEHLGKGLLEAMPLRDADGVSVGAGAGAIASLDLP